MKPKSNLRAYIGGIFLGLTIAFTGFALADKNTEKRELPIQDVQRFTTAISHIKNYYVNPVSDSKLFDNAIRGMLSGLDPHSDYLDAEDFKALTSTTAGQFGGLGMEVTMQDGILKVVSPIDNTPAQKAGVKANDLIIGLDKTPIKGMTLREAINKMRGKPGTAVTLTIVRKGEKQPLTVKLVREIIQVESIKSKILDKGYGYIHIIYFQAPTSANMVKAIKQLQAESGGQLKGLVLDLRNNPGGLLDSAIAISDLFLDSKQLQNNQLIVYTKSRVPVANYSIKATPGDILNKAPIVVLINGGSASGSEIVAGALKDHKRAILIGSKTFGKGSVQTVLPLDNKTGIKLTTALYYTPSGHSIQAKGIKPDIYIDENLKLSKSEKHLPTELMIKEINLNKHLKNAHEQSDNKVKENSSENKALLKKDYPLQEALNILKGMVIVGERQ